MEKANLECIGYINTPYKTLEQCPKHSTARRNMPYQFAHAVQRRIKRINGWTVCSDAVLA